MPRREAPPWFYTSHPNSVLPGLGRSKSTLQVELDRLEKVQGWLRSVDKIQAKNPYAFDDPTDGSIYHVDEGYVYPIPPIERHNNESIYHNICNSNKQEKHAKTGIADRNINNLKNSKKLYSLPEDIESNNIHGNVHTTPSHNIHAADSATSRRTYFSDNVISKHRKARTDLTNHLELNPISKSASRPLHLERNNTALPNEIQGAYHQTKVKHFYGKGSTFSNNMLSAYDSPFRNGIGPIQRPHSPVMNVMERQKTRYGDSLLMTKPRASGMNDQQSRTYKLHSQLKQMLSEN